MITHKFIIKGQPRVKKNSKTVMKFGNRLIPVSKKDVRDAEEAASLELKNQKNKLGLKTIKDFVNVKFSFYLETRRIPDLSNLYELPQDAMEKSGIIENDRLIAGHDGSRRYYDKENPRTEIEISFLSVSGDNRF